MVVVAAVVVVFSVRPRRCTSPTWANTPGAACTRAGARAHSVSVNTRIAFIPMSRACSRSAFLGVFLRVRGSSGHDSFQPDTNKQ